MEVKEARRLNLFPSQLITNNRDIFICQEQGNNAMALNVDSTTQIMALNVNSTTQIMGSGPTSLTSVRLPDTLCLPPPPFHHHQSVAYDDSFQPKTSMKADSGLTYNPHHHLSAPRKRPRDYSLLENPSSIIPRHHKEDFNDDLSQFQSSLGDEISLRIKPHQLEMDRIISQHNIKIRLQLEEEQKQLVRLLVSTIREGILEKLTEKDEEIQRMGKWNLVLQERVKSLCAENQLWRDLAQTNEATANTLRNNLEQVLAHVSDDRLTAVDVASEATAVKDLESCCGSSDTGRERGEEVAPSSRGRTSAAYADGGRIQAAAYSGGGRGRMCRRCGERESSVLLLPCRHLCLCANCGSTLLSTCPACNCSMNATVHVNMS